MADFYETSAKIVAIHYQYVWMSQCFKIHPEILLRLEIANHSAVLI